MRSLTPVAAGLSLCALALPVSIAATNAALALLSVALLVRARSGTKIDSRLVALGARALRSLALHGSGAGRRLAGLAAASLRDAAKDLHHFWSLALFTAALALEPQTPLRPVLGVSFGAMALFAIAQCAFGGKPDGLMLRAHGFVHPVVFGEQMAVATLGGACVLLRPTLQASRSAASLFTALTFTALALSQTRMALLSVLAGFAIVALLEPRARRWALPALLTVAAVGVAWEFIPNGGTARSEPS